LPASVAWKASKKIKANKIIMDYQIKREEYITGHCTAEDALLADLNRQTYLKMLNPKMLSGHYQGKFLEMISFMIKPRQILEIGTFTGYSAICMARGLDENGRLHTIDNNDEIKDFALKYIRKSGMERKIVLHTGNALEIIPVLKGPFDLVFIDGEKSEYPQYYHLSLPKVKQGGFIIADNVLWDGKVYRPEFKDDVNTRHIIEFNKMVMDDDRVENILIPVRDGLMIMRKR
jgi:caffeoyl-CoA O-methyltransferase